MAWLQGGPYYSLSLILKNEIKKEEQLRNILTNLNKLDFNVDLVNSISEIEFSIQNYKNGRFEDDIIYREIDLNIWAEIAGKRKGRFVVTELSGKLIVINFWVFGSIHDAEEWDQKGLKEADKLHFINFFLNLTNIYNPVFGTIGYENDANEVFMCNENYPNENYNLSNLTLAQIKERFIENSEFEFCWIDSKYFNSNRVRKIIIIDKLKLYTKTL